MIRTQFHEHLNRPAETMKGTLAVVALALTLTCSAFAQDSQHCYGIGIHSTDSSTTVCEFSDGRANVAIFSYGDNTSTWYTADEWSKAKAGILADARKAVLDEFAAEQAFNKEWDEAGREATAHLNAVIEEERIAQEEQRLAKRRTKGSCEGAGGNWSKHRSPKCQLPK
jgi:hypothetical protein